MILNTAQPKVLTRILAHPAVDSVSDERFLGDGCWVFLKEGYRSVGMDCGTIHEDSWTKCERVLREGVELVKPA